MIKLILRLSVSFLLTVALSIISILCLSSCSGGEDEPQIPKVEKRMKSIDKLTFVYSNDKIVQEKTVYSPEEIYTTDITYSESTIKRGKDVFHLKNGLITKYIQSHGWYQEFTYEDGHIKTWKKYKDNGEQYEDITFEWKDGVIVRQTEYHPSYTGDVELFCDYTYTYEQNYDYGGAIAAFQHDSLFYDYLPESLIIQGYFGKWPKYLVSASKDEADYFSPSEYTYILDSDGYPIKIEGGVKAKITWEKVK